MLALKVQDFVDLVFLRLLSKLCDRHIQVAALTCRFGIFLNYTLHACFLDRGVGDRIIVLGDHLHTFVADVYRHLNFAELAALTCHFVTVVRQEQNYIFNLVSGGDPPRLLSRDRWHPVV